MKLTHLIQSFNIGGLEMMVVRLSQQMQRLGHTIEVIAYEEDGPLADEFRRHGIAAHVIPKPEGAQPFFSFALAKHLQERDIQLLHTHHLGPFIYGSQAAHLANIPHLHTEHSHELYDTPRRQLIGKTMARYATLTAVSDEIAAFHSEHFGHRLNVIPNGVAIPALDHHLRDRIRAQMGWRYNEVIIGCVARLAPEKDLPTLLNAFAITQKSSDPARLIIIGDGPCRSSLEQLSARLNIQGRVTFLGQRQDLHELYQALDLVALSSVREGLPLALLEAMSFSLPIVSTAVGAIPELIKAIGGELVEAQDAAGLAQALHGYINNPAKRLIDGSHARRHVCTYYSLEQMSARYHDLYKHLLNRGERRGLATA